MTSNLPDLSVILPCYRAAPLARRSVAELDGALQELGIEWEVPVVDDGGHDFLPGEWHDHPRVQFLHHAVNRGKGAAVRTFDVELVYVALKHRPDIKRIPVRLLHNDTMTVRLLRDSVLGAADVPSIKANQLRGLNRSATLEAIVRRDFEPVRAQAATTDAPAARA